MLSNWFLLAYKTVSKKAPTFMEEMNCEAYIPLIKNI